MEHLTEAEFQRRLPLLCALTTLFLDTEVTEHDLSHTAFVATKAGYSAAEVEAMLFHDVAPVFGSNLTAPLGEWAPWPDSFVAETMRAWYSRPHQPGGLAAAAMRGLLRGDWERLRQHLAYSTQTPAG